MEEGWWGPAGTQGNTEQHREHIGGRSLDELLFKAFYRYRQVFRPVSGGGI